MLLGSGFLLLPFFLLRTEDWLFNVILFTAQSGYLHFLRDWYKCFSSLCNCPGFEQIVLHINKLAITSATLFNIKL